LEWRVELNLHIWKMDLKSDRCLTQGVIRSVPVYHQRNSKTRLLNKQIDWMWPRSRNENSFSSE
jgi:hypothetical protein